MKKILTTALAAAFSLGLAGVALADDRATFESLDADGDGYVARGDVPTDHALSREFAKHDTDGDGRLSQAEFDAYTAAMKDDRKDY